MSIEIIHRATADTDYTIAMLDGQPVAAVEESDGGYYAVIHDSEYVQNQHQQRYWYVTDGEWDSRSIFRGALVDVMDGYTRRDPNDGAQDIYDGDIADLS